MRTDQTQRWDNRQSSLNEISEVQRIFGAQLMTMRIHNRLSQEQLAERAKVNVKTIARIESGKGNPSLSTIVTLIKALNIDANTLIKVRKK